MRPSRVSASRICGRCRREGWPRVSSSGRSVVRSDERQAFAASMRTSSRISPAVESGWCTTSTIPMTADLDLLLPSADPVQLIDPRGQADRACEGYPMPGRRRAAAGATAHWWPPVGSTTRPTRWCGRAGWRSTPPRTARRPARLPRRRCSRTRTGCSRPTATPPPSSPGASTRSRCWCSSRATGTRATTPTAPGSRRRRHRWPPSCCTPSASPTPPGCAASRPS